MMHSVGQVDNDMHSDGLVSMNSYIEHVHIQYILNKFIGCLQLSYEYAIEYASRYSYRRRICTSSAGRYAIYIT